MRNEFNDFLPIFQTFLDKGLSIQDALSFILNNKNRIINQNLLFDDYYFIYNGMELYCLFIPKNDNDYLWSIYEEQGFLPLQCKSENLGTLKNGDAIIDNILRAGHKYAETGNGNKELARSLKKYQFNSSGYHLR